MVLRRGEASHVRGVDTWQAWIWESRARGERDSTSMQPKLGRDECVKQTVSQLGAFYVWLQPWGCTDPWGLVLAAVGVFGLLIFCVRNYLAFFGTGHQGFITQLLTIGRGHDAVPVRADRLSKMSQFAPTMSR